MDDDWNEATAQINGIANAMLALVEALPPAIGQQVSDHLKTIADGDETKIKTVDPDSLEHEAAVQKLALLRAMIGAARCS